MRGGEVTTGQPSYSAAEGAVLVSAGVLVSSEGSSVAEAGDSTELTVTVIRCRFRLLGLLISAVNGVTLAGS